MKLKAGDEDDLYGSGGGGRGECGPQRSLSLCQHFEGQSCHLGGRQRRGAERRLAGQFQVCVGGVFGLAGVAAPAGGMLRKETRVGGHLEAR